GFQIDDQFEHGGLLDRQVGGVCALEDFVHVGRGAAIQVAKARSIRYETPEVNELPRVEHRGQPMLSGKIDDALSLSEEHRARKHEEGLGALADHRRECAAELV